MEDLRRDLFASVFHGAAADGAADAAARGHQHPRPRSARRAAAAGDDGDENGVLAAAQRISQRFKELFHLSIPPWEKRERSAKGDRKRDRSRDLAEGFPDGLDGKNRAVVPEHVRAKIWLRQRAHFGHGPARERAEHGPVDPRVGDDGKIALRPVRERAQRGKAAPGRVPGRFTAGRRERAVRAAPGVFLRKTRADLVKAQPVPGAAVLFLQTARDAAGKSAGQRPRRLAAAAHRTAPNGDDTRLPQHRRERLRRRGAGFGDRRVRPAAQAAFPAVPVVRRSMAKQKDRSHGIPSRLSDDRSVPDFIFYHPLRFSSTKTAPGRSAVPGGERASFLCPEVDMRPIFDYSYNTVISL